MLDIDPIFPRSTYSYGGSGIFDIAKNIIQKSSNSTVGKEIKTSILSGVTEASKNAAEGAFKKLGLPTSKKRRKRQPKTGSKKQKGSGIVYD